MPVRSDALANTYNIPLIQQQPVAPQGPFQDEIGGPEEGLAEVDGKTAEYFDKWSALKGFARDVWENYGIDVRYPDPSVPESNRLHRIYLKSIADLKHQGSRLKTSQTMLNASLQRGDIINADYHKTPFADLKAGTDFIANELDPVVTEANEKLRQQYYDQTSLNEAKAYYAKVKGELEKNAANDPQNATYWKRQIQGLVDPTSAHKQFAPPRDRAGEREDAEIEAAGAFLKERANLLNGLHDSFVLSEEKFGPEGERIKTSNANAGETYANHEVIETQYWPEKKETYLLLKVPQKDGTFTTKLERVTGKNPMNFAKETVASNQKFASTGEKLDLYAQKHGLFKKSGELNAQPLLREDADQVYKKMDEEIKAGANMAEKRRILSDSLDSMQGRSLTNWFGDEQEFEGKDGKVITIKKKGDGFDVTNMKDHVTPQGLKNYKAKGAKMSKQELMSFLLNKGVLKDPEVLDAPTGIAAKKDKEAQTLLDQAGTKRYEDILKKYGE